jgi:hypothetical protein
MDPLEKKWLDAFRKSPLVNRDTGEFDKKVARQLFYGRTDPAYHESWPDNYKKFFDAVSPDNKADDVPRLVDFLSMTGIRLRKEQILQHLEREPRSYASVFKRVHDILKTLAFYEDRIDTSNPFKDNQSDFYFFLALGASGSRSRTQARQRQMQLFEDTELPVLYRKLSQLPEGYEDDPVIGRIFEAIEYTSKSFFITGKAGTGKSTFIHYLSQKTGKKVVMLAFTGIAAINAGGQTIHSFFKFPLKPLLPADEEITIFQAHNPTRKVIEKTEVFVIDEVSMLRSDVMEAIDHSLRFNGGDPILPFGGKQMIFVGDIFQLPPVVDTSNEAEALLFSDVFRSEYFFDAHAYKKLNPVYFEFRKVHRQKDDLEFVEMLDKVRLCKADDDTLFRFNRRYYPNYTPKIDEFVMYLTSRNQIADRENAQKLSELEYTSFTFNAIIEGEFREDRYPTARVLELKKRAQVIFIKNDLAGRWVNGTIAKIEFISEEYIEVKLQDGSVHKLEPATWENRKYNFDRGRGKIMSETMGTFTQYPVKLAWAITIHKSQGLTFDKVVIDMGTGAFVNGQAYTAVSRCRTLKGIALKKLLRAEDIIADNRLLHYHFTEQLVNELNLDPTDPA